MGKGRRLAQFCWDVYSYKFLSLHNLDCIEPKLRPAEAGPAPGPFLVVPYPAARWPSRPQISIGGEISPPWKGLRLPPDKRGERRQYPDVPYSERKTPMQDPKLYRVFAQIDCTESGILQFAQEHGHLGLAEPLGRLRTNDPITSRVWGEDIRIWTDEIAGLRKAVTLWDRIKKHDREWFEARIQWSQDSDGSVWVTYEDPEPIQDLSATWNQHIFRVISSPKIRPTESRFLQPGDFFHAAELLVEQMVNERLEQYTHSRILRDNEGHDPALHIVPWHLLGAIWLQFARAMNDKWPYKRCSYCREWTQVAPQGLHRPKVYCGDRCKLRSFRKNKREEKRKERLRRGRSRA